MIILFVVCVWLYFIAEGVTEGFTWSVNRTMTPDMYHVFRLGENLGILGAFLIVRSVSIPFWVLLLSMSSGLALYELAFNKTKYNEFLYNKTSTWFGIPHPKGWVWLCVFLVSVFIMVKGHI